MFLSILLAGLILLYWLVMLAISLVGLPLIRQLPRTTGAQIGQQKDPVLVSVIVAAKEEEEAIADTIRSLLAQDYPRLEVIAVNDRSEDRTGERMEDVKRWQEREGPRQVRLQVVHLTELPAGWLGKNHALYAGFQQAQGDIVLFTDADVRFERSTLSSAVAYFQKQQADHLTVIPHMIAKGFWLRAFVHYFLFSLCLVQWPWWANIDSQHRHGMGIGAFNMLSRRAYEAIGTHEAIRNRPDDDLQLGARVKQMRLRQRLVTGQGQVAVEWYKNLSACFQGLEKNLFAGLRYQFGMYLTAVVCQFVLFCLPFFAVWCTHGLTRWMYGLSVLLAMGLYVVYTRAMSADKGYEVLTFPISTLLFLYVVTRSTYLTYKQGGIYWRGTFYSLKELRKMVRTSS